MFGDLVSNIEEPVFIPETEANVFEDTVKRTVLEDEFIPVVDEPVAVSSVVTPESRPAADMFVVDEEPVVVPVTEAAVYEDNIKRTVLEDEIIPEYQHPTVIHQAQTPISNPISQTFVVEEEEVVMPETRAYITEDGKKVFIEDEAHKSRTTIVDESIIEAPVVRSIFEVADDYSPISDKLDNTESLGNYDYIELNYNGESESQSVEQPVLIKRVNTTVIEDNKVVLQVTEEHREALPTVEKVVLADESKEVTKKRINISTIPIDSKGNVTHEEPMIPMIPSEVTKGVGSNAAELPFVLPATEEGRKTMADYKDILPKEDESVSGNLIRQMQDIPVAPEISLDGDNQPPKEKVAPAFVPASNEGSKPEVIVADSDMNLDFGLFDKEEEESIPEPEIVPEPEEEPIPELIEEEISEPEEEIITEPEEEPVVESIPEEEPVIEEVPVVEEEPAVEDPIIEEPIYTDAEHADELMTDKEAEEHIEIIEEAPDRERKGKLHAINLDTLCENFEDDEEVTLEALKEKKLAPKNAGRVKILARGTMTKKLDIVADSFSIQAVKMISLAGGRAEQYK